MTAGELVLVVVAVLATLAFAALVVTLVRVRDTLGELRAEVATVRGEAAPLLAELREATDEARTDLERFDRLLGSAEAISGALEQGSRVTRTALSAPMIKAAGLATGTSRAVRRLRTGA